MQHFETFLFLCCFNKCFLLFQSAKIVIHLHPTPPNKEPGPYQQSKYSYIKLSFKEHGQIEVSLFILKVYWLFGFIVFSWISFYFFLLVVLQKTNRGDDQEKVGEYACFTAHSYRYWTSGEELKKQSFSFFIIFSIPGYKQLWWETFCEFREPLIWET